MNRPILEAVGNNGECVRDSFSPMMAIDRAPSPYPAFPQVLTFSRKELTYEP
ncbi:hypothetical protein [uncultured Rubinisphaera sp.]|uniref:hypothetical protein n=1 Tax=uncultured Rubinisphaera sp. TaxID=1678686 RepID=UPI0030DA2B1C